jgi:hypothetical protein
VGTSFAPHTETSERGPAKTPPTIAGRPFEIAFEENTNGFETVEGALLYVEQRFTRLCTVTTCRKVSQEYQRIIIPFRLEGQDVKTAANHAICVFNEDRKFVLLQHLLVEPQKSGSPESGVRAWMSEDNFAAHYLTMREAGQQLPAPPSKWDLCAHYSTK